jgi:hypothetical protein
MVRFRPDGRECRGKIGRGRAGEGKGLLRKLSNAMNLPKVISDLRAELADVERAIESLERLAATPRKRGRPPKSRYQNGTPNGAAKPPKTRAAGADYFEGPSGAD